MSSQMGLSTLVGAGGRYLATILKYKYQKLKYQKRAFTQSFDWGWGKTNYNRIALVNLLISKKQNPAYLEIGCQSNTLFDSVPANIKTGIDPVSGGNVRATSDAFFEKNTQLYDIIFIDGLHTYQQVQKDVINSIRFLKPGGYVALHDMLPGSWLEHHVPRLNGIWTGDVWKVAFELAQSTGIDFKIVKIDYGVGVFRVTEEKPQPVDLAEELKEKEFEYFYKNIGKLPLVEWQDFVKWLG